MMVMFKDVKYVNGCIYIIGFQLFIFCPSKFSADLIDQTVFGVESGLMAEFKA